MKRVEDTQAFLNNMVSLAEEFGREGKRFSSYDSFCVRIREGNWDKSSLHMEKIVNDFFNKTINYGRGDNREYCLAVNDEHEYEIEERIYLAKFIFCELLEGEYDAVFVRTADFSHIIRLALSSDSDDALDLFDGFLSKAVSEFLTSSRKSDSLGDILYLAYNTKNKKSNKNGDVPRHFFHICDILLANDFELKGKTNDAYEENKHIKHFFDNCDEE